MYLGILFAKHNHINECSNSAGRMGFGKDPKQRLFGLRHCPNDSYSDEPSTCLTASSN